MNCKPGDLAKMVECGIPAAVGLIVEVLESAGLDPYYGPTYGPVWLCKAISGAKSDHGYCMPGEGSIIPDAWLRPIRGLDCGDEVTDSQPVPLPQIEKVSA